MNPAAPVSPNKSRRVWWWLAAGFMLLASPFILLGVAAVSILTLDRDASFLRREVMAATDSHWHKKVQVSLGSLSLGAVRTGLRFVHHENMDEARLALAAVKRASVGVYEHSGDMKDWTREKLFTHTDEVMRRRGWSRLVGVRDDHATVLVYADDDIGSDGRIDLCVAVVDGRNLVVVSTRVEAGKLLELAERKLPPGGLREKLAQL